MLGKGGMGTVYLARKQATGEEVAVKLMRPQYVSSDEAVQLFLREVSILSRLNHPRIVRFFEAGLAGGHFFLTMEYVDRLDLEEVLTQQTPRSAVRTACGIACQVLEALRYAHERSFIHRDIKPANILISRSGHKLRTKVADFGLAKNYEQGGFSGLTGHGELRGSLPFMAPEQMLDCRSVKPAADIYSVGATLYYLLVHATPHDFSTGRDPYAILLEDEIVPLQRRCPELPPGLADLVHRAMAKEPQQRYGTAREMRRMLMPYAQGLV
jgi:serine/threonine-protein kinase